MEIRSDKQRNVHFKVVITEVNNETGEERIISDDLFKSFNFLAVDYKKDGSMTECMLNENMTNLAAMIAASKKFKHAARLADVFLEASKEEEEDRNSMLEDMLMDMIGDTEGGIQ